MVIEHFVDLLAGGELTDAVATEAVTVQPVDGGVMCAEATVGESEQLADDGVTDDVATEQPAEQSADA